MSYCGYPEPTSKINDQGGRDIKLETIWQPYWDAGYFAWPMNVEHQFYGTFFQNPARDYRVSNLVTAACLSWPKRYHIWELQFLFVDPIEPSDYYAEIHVGEKTYLKFPLILFDEIGRNSYKTCLQKAIFIPSVQNFIVRISGVHNERLPSIIYCCLHGYQQRELQ